MAADGSLGKRKRVKEATSTEAGPSIAADGLKNAKASTIPAWPELLRGIQGDKGEPGAIQALHHLCRILSQQGSSAATSKKPAHDLHFQVWTAFLQHWQSDPSLKDIIAAWEKGDQSGNTSLTVAALQTYATLLRVASLPSSGIIAAGSENQKSLVALLAELINQLKHVQKYLVQQGKNDLTTAALGLVSALLRIVSYAPSRATTVRRVWQTLNLDSRAIIRLLGTKRKVPIVTRRGQKPDIRHLMLSAMLPLLSPDGPLALKIDILSQKGVLVNIFKGLADDPKEVVESVFDTMARLTSLKKLGLELRCRIAEDSWQEAIKLLSLDLPDDNSEIQQENAKFPLALTAQRYLRYVVSSLSVSPDTHAGLTSNQKRVLGALLGSLAISDFESHAQIALHALTNAIDLLPGFWAKFAPSLEPRLSSRWVTSVGFASQLVAADVPVSFSNALQSVLDDTSSPTVVPAVPVNTGLLLDTALMPAALGKAWMSKALQQSQTTPLVSYLTLSLLHAGLAKCCALADAAEVAATRLQNQSEQRAEAWRAVGRRLRRDAKERLPDLQILIALVQKSLGRVFSRAGSVASTAASEGGVSDAESGPEENILLISLALRTIKLYQSVAPSIFSSLRFDFGKVLQSALFSQMSPNATPLAVIGQASLLQIVARRPDDEGEGAVSWQWHKSVEGLPSPIASILEISFASQSSHLRHVARETALSLLGHSSIFQDDTSEADLWLSALQPDDIQLRQQSLAFLDGCFQRYLQTPFKYVDGLHGLTAADTQRSCTSGDCRKASPLLATAIEQLAYHCTKPDSAAALVSYMGRLVLLFAGNRSCLCLAETACAAVVKVCCAAAGQKQALQVAKVYAALVSRLRTAPKNIKAVHVNLPEALAISDPLSPLITMLRLSMEGRLAAFQDIMQEEPGRRACAAVAEAVVRYLLYLAALDKKTNAVIGELLRNVFALCQEAERFRAMKVLIAGPLIAGSGLDEAVTAVLADSAPELKKLGVQLSGSALGALASGDISDKQLQVILTVVSVDQALQLLADAFRPDSPAKKSAAFAAALCIHLSASEESAVATFVGRNWEAIMSLPADSGITLLAAQAERASPLVATTIISEPSLCKLRDDISWIRSAGNAILDNGSLTPARCRLLSVAILLDHGVWTRWQNVHHSTLPFDAIASAMLASARVATALGKADSVLVGTAHRSAAVERLLDSSARSEMRQLCGQVLAAWSSSPSEFQLLHKALDASLGPACASSPALYDAITLKALEQVYNKSGKQLEGFSLLENLINESLRWLVRRFAEDAENTDQVSSWIDVVSSCLQKYSGKWLLKPHLVEPVITAGIKNRLADEASIRFMTTLSKQCKLQTIAYNRLLQTLLADARTRSGLSIGSPLRTCVADLLAALHSQIPDALAHSSTLSHLISYYGGTLHRADQALLRILRLSEAFTHVALRPVVDKWIPSHLKGLAASPVQVLANLDPAKMQRSCEYVLRRRQVNEAPNNLEGTYDPNYWLGYASLILDGQDLSRNSWVALAASGVFGLATCSLASNQRVLQLAGDRVLAKARNGLQAAAEFREKEEIVYLLDSVKNLILPSAAFDESLPPLVAMFLSHAIQEVGRPEGFSYPLIWRYLLSRPTVSTTDVPLFYNLLYSSSDNARQERLWLLQMLKDGTHTSEDWRILKRRQVPELLLSLLGNRVVTDDPTTRLAIVELLAHISEIPLAAHDLVAKSGIFGSIAQMEFSSASEASTIARVVDNCTCCVQPTKLRRARDGLWIADATEALLATWTSAGLDAHSLSLACHTLKRLAVHLMQSPKKTGDRPDAVASAALRKAFERATEAIINIASRLGSIDETTAKRLGLPDLLDGAVRLDFVLDSKLGSGSGDFVQRLMQLGILMDVPGLLEEAIRARHVNNVVM